MGGAKCIAVTLAGGIGERLGALAHYYSNPAVYFGGNYRIIDFTLSNCRRSGISAVGIVSQHFSTDLYAYISDVYGRSTEREGIFMLPVPKNEALCGGMTDAARKTAGFMDSFNPEHVLVLSGSHVYKMDYSKMIAFHRETGASATVASIPAPMGRVPRYGALDADKSGRVRKSGEKSGGPVNRLASIGVYVFRRNVLERYLPADGMGNNARHDLGENIISAMLASGESVYTYSFNGYWRDIETLDSLWEANMDLVGAPPAFHLLDDGGKWGIFGSDTGAAPSYMSARAVVNQSLVSGGCTISGRVERSILAGGVTVDNGAEIVDSVVMPGAYIGENAKVYRAVVGTEAKIMDGAVIGSDDGTDFFIDHVVCSRDISLIAPWAYIPKGVRFRKNSHIYRERLQKYETDFQETPKYHPGRERFYPDPGVNIH